MTRADDGVRLTGVIVSVHHSQDEYGGLFGEIKADDGRCYTYDNGHVFRNRSFAEVGGKVAFTVVSYSYATGIDRTDKHRRLPEPSADVEVSGA